MHSHSVSGSPRESVHVDAISAQSSKNCGADVSASGLELLMRHLINSGDQALRDSQLQQCVVTSALMRHGLTDRVAWHGQIKSAGIRVPSARAKNGILRGVRFSIASIEYVFDGKSPPQAAAYRRLRGQPFTRPVRTDVALRKPVRNV